MAAVVVGLGTALALAACIGMQRDLVVSIHCLRPSAAGVDLSVEANALITKYEWTFGDGGTSEKMSPAHVYEQRGTYTINLKVIDSDGRMGSAYEVVTVGHDWYVPNEGGLQTVVDKAEPDDTIFVIDDPDKDETHSVVLEKDVDIQGRGATLSAIRYVDAAGSLSGCAVVGTLEEAALTLISASPIIVDCTFSDNTGEYGAAVHAQNSAASFENCEFTGNSVDYDGGAVYASNSALTFTDCVFSNNDAEYGGGAVCAAGTHAWPSFESCTFATNHAEDAGGAILLRMLEGGAVDAEESLSHVIECSFISNRAEQAIIADAALVGGAIHVGSGCRVIQRDNTFTGNWPGDVIYEDL